MVDIPYVKQLLFPLTGLTFNSQEERMEQEWKNTLGELALGGLFLAAGLVLHHVFKPEPTEFDRRMDELWSDPKFSQYRVFEDI